MAGSGDQREIGAISVTMTWPVTPAAALTAGSGSIGPARGRVAALIFAAAGEFQTDEHKSSGKCALTRPYSRFGHDKAQQQHTSQPGNGEKEKCGPVPEPVRRYTSQCCADRCASRNRDAQ